MKIGNKTVFYRLWRAGLLGNRPQIWPDMHALCAAILFEDLAPSTPIVIRSTDTAAWPTRYDIPAGDALLTAPPGATFNESMDEREIVLQGEAMRSETGLDLTYSTIPQKMKVALAKAPRYAQGLRAKLILDHYLAPASRDDLEALWDLYPDAVIEFGVYSRNLGDQPHRNTIIWEVRNY